MPSRWSRLLGLCLLSLSLSACLSSAGPAEPTISDQPKDRIGFIGQQTRFDVGVSGKGPLSFQWRRNGVPIEGATQATYLSPRLTAADNGSKYSVTISNSAGSVTSNEATLTVNDKPTVTSSPQSVTLSVGATATFTVAASGQSLSYQWYRDEEPISGATSTTYSFTVTAADDGAEFRAYALNLAGFTASEAAMLTVSAAPGVLVQPVAQTLAAGETLLLGVRATGGSLSYQWRRDGANIPDATAAVLRIASVAATDAGAYTVAITNTLGAITSAAATVAVTTAAPITFSAPPAQIALSPSASAAGSFTLVRRSDGTIASWGFRGEGQRGDGAGGAATDTIGAVTLPAGRRAVQIAAGGAHGLALLDDGKVFAWGGNGSGQLALDNALQSFSPIEVELPRPAIAVAAGRAFSVAVLDDGSVRTWGSNAFGQLGDDGREASSDPVLALGLDQVVAVAAGTDHVLALRADGSVWAWGANGTGQLGNGRFKPSRVPVDTGLRGIGRISAGAGQSIAISQRGGLYLWGKNADGQLGLGAAAGTDVGVPTLVRRNVIDAATGERASFALGADRLVVATGANESGSLGDGGTTARNTFAPVSTISNVISLATGGRSFAGAIEADGTTYLWGDNTARQLGIATLESTGTPTPRAVPSFDAIP